MQNNPTITLTVEAHVVAHILHKGKPATRLMVPQWNSTWPITLYAMRRRDIDQLPRHATVKIALRKGELKPGKDATKPYNYFWSFVERVG